MPSPPSRRTDQADGSLDENSGASAASPSQIPPMGWLNVLQRAAAGFLENRIMSEAAAVTFYALLALFPATAAFISVYGLFGNPASLLKQVDGLNGLVPGGGIDIVNAQIAALSAKGHKELGFAAIFSLAISLWTANSAIKSLFEALNVVYHEREKRSYARRTLIAFGFTLGAFVFVVVALAVVLVIPILLNSIGLGKLTGLLLSVLRWPVMLVLVAFALSVIYRYGPSRNTARWRWVSWGGIAAAVVWIFASLLFSFYAAHFGSYDKTYGSLGAVAGFMTWIWISSVVVLMGAELNAELEEQTFSDSTIGPEKPQGAPGALKADVKS